MDPTSVSATRRIAQVGASILFCFLTVGLVFGFAALKPILLDAGVYQHLCTAGQSTCKAQDTRLNSLFVVATSVNNVAALPMGSFLDKVGPRVACITGAIIFGLGCVVFSLNIVTSYIDTYLLGFSLLALGSPAMFLAQFHLSNAFPARSGLILGAITGAFDASSLPLCFYKVAYFALGKPSVKIFFLTYTVVPLLIIIQQISFGPSEIYTRPAPGLPSQSDIHSFSIPQPTPSPFPTEQSPFLSPNDSSFTIRRRASIGPSPALGNRRMSSAFSRISYDIPDTADDDEVKLALASGEKGDGIVGVMFGKSVKAQINSTWWWAMEFMTVVHMTRINWYLATVNSQLIYYTGEAQLADQLTDAFIFLLPIGGIVSIPFVGYLIDTRPILDITLIMSLMGLLFGVLTLLPTTIPQLIGIAMLVVFRPLYYTAISDYAAKVFGFETFGTVYGLAMTISGLLGLILTPLDVLTKGPLGGSYTPVNTVLLILGLLSSLALAYKVWTAGRPGKIRLEDGHPARTDIIVEDDED